MAGVCSLHNLEKNKDGYKCPECLRLYKLSHGKAYKEKNKEKLSEQKKAYHKANKDEINAFRKHKRQLLKEASLEGVCEAHGLEKNKENRYECAECSRLALRAYHKAYRENKGVKEKVKAYNKNYYQKNREEILAHLQLIRKAAKGEQF